MPLRKAPWLLWLFPASCFALLAEPEAIEAQLSRALLVAEIRVTAVEGIAPGGDGSDIYTRARAEVEKILSLDDDGHWLPSEGQRISLVHPGGEAGGLGVYLTGYPRPRVGRRYRAYLVRAGGEDFRVTGLEAGLVPIDGKRAFSRNRTDGSNGEGNGAFLYWDKTYLPIPYFIAEETFRGVPDYVEAIDRSFRTWQEPGNARMAFLPLGCSRGNRNLNDGVNNIILIRDEWPFDASAIAITRNFYIAGDSPRAGLILDSDILLNGVNHQFTTTGESGKHDVQNIVTHEVGHFIGLGHEVAPDPDDQAVMFTAASTGETTKRTLKANDLSALLSAYAGGGPKPAASPMPSCAVHGGGTSCLAVHASGTTPPGWPVRILMLLFGVGVLAAGRVIARSEATKQSWGIERQPRDCFVALRAPRNDATSGPASPFSPGRRRSLSETGR